jgi:predicted PurR-regulated permease PerM
VDKGKRMLPRAFTYRHLVLVVLLGLLLAIHWLAPMVAFELELVLGLAAILAPAIDRLAARLGGNRGLAVTLVSVVVLVALTFLVVFVMPSVARSLKDMLIALREQIPALKAYLEVWIAGLGAWTVEFDLDESLEKIKEALRKDGAAAAFAVMVGKTSLGIVLGLGQILIGCVILAILAASWVPYVAWSKDLVRRLVPESAERVLRIASASQENGIAMARGLGIMCLIFTSSYVIILATLGLPLGKIVVLGLTLGLFSSLPAVGGFVSAMLSVLIALAHWGLWGWQGWVLVSAGIAAHFIEAKFLTPRIVGHAIDVPPFIMIGALFSGVAMNGAAGVFQALMLLPILRAMIDELPSSGATAPAASPPPPAPALLTKPPESAVAAGRGGPQPPIKMVQGGNKKKRR